MTRRRSRPPAALTGVASEVRAYYGLDDVGVIKTAMWSVLELAEFVSEVRALGSTLDWTANPSPEALAAWDAREL